MKSFFRSRRAFAGALNIAALAATVGLVACTEEPPTKTPPGPVTGCKDVDSTYKPVASASPEMKKQVTGRLAECTGMTFAKRSAIAEFLGTDKFKFAFTKNKNIYLVTYESEEPTITNITQGDEVPGTISSDPVSPLFSEDGNLITYAGDNSGRTVTYVHQAVPAPQMGWRAGITNPFSTKSASEPHFHKDQSGKTWVYFMDSDGTLSYDASGDTIRGNTYRTEFASDFAFGPVQKADIKGGYRGGISKDGKYAGTTYKGTAIFDIQAQQTFEILGGEVQQCNPSMNAFPTGSAHSDYLMILAFGGGSSPMVPLYAVEKADTLFEGRHENLWIYNKGGRVVWQAKLPNREQYWRWEKPEWSTHPQFASSVALYRPTEGDGDLYFVKIGDLSNFDEEAHIQQNKSKSAVERMPAQHQGTLKVITGGISSAVFSHLWVGQ